MPIFISSWTEGLSRSDSSHRRRQLHAEVDEAVLLVPAADVLGRVTEDVVRVDE